MAMNTYTLVSCIRSSLQGFFEYCEVQNGIKVDELNNLFKQYFETSTTANNDILDSNDDNIDEKPVKKSQLVKKKSPPSPVKTSQISRKMSGKKDLKPRSEQIQIASIDLNKKKLPELKEYSRERGLKVTGTKAELIENLRIYENDQENTSDQLDDDVTEEISDIIEIRKPKIKSRNLAEPADKLKFTIMERNDIKMVLATDSECFFALDDDNIVYGWIETDEVNETDESETVNIHALTKEFCKLAKSLGLQYHTPENLNE